MTDTIQISSSLANFVEEEAKKPSAHMYLSADSAQWQMEMNVRRPPMNSNNGRLMCVESPPSSFEGKKEAKGRKNSQPPRAKRVSG